jgi:heterodisulfide reductase subunit B
MEDPRLLKDVNTALGEVGREYNGKASVEHVVTALSKEYSENELSELSIAPLKGLKAAPFYGCHLFLPSRYAGFDDPEFPKKLDRLIELTGAEAVDYHEKTSCCIGCGNFFGKVSEDASMRLVEAILEGVKTSEADVIVTTCPFCMMQLEVGQMRLKNEKGKGYGIPVIHYVDMLGLSMGIAPEDLGLNLRRTDVLPTLKKLDT